MEDLWDGLWNPCRLPLVVQRRAARVRDGQRQFADFARDVFAYYPRLCRVREFVLSNLENDVSLRRAADVAGLELSYFSTYFHQKVGVRYSAWVASLRVERAMELLAEADQTIASTAFAVGFGSVRSFERAFKRYAGRTARDFRREQRPSSGKSNGSDSAQGTINRSPLKTT